MAGATPAAPLSLLIVDDWLDPPRLAAVHALTQAHRAARGESGLPFSWYSPKQSRHVSAVAREFREVAEAYVDDLVTRLQPFLQCEAEGYEWWSNYDNMLHWHMDKDETLHDDTGQLRTPLWSTLLYTEVSIRGRGGELALLADAAQPAPYSSELTVDEVPQKCHIVSPKTNRLVVFGPGIMHRINPFHGSRASLPMNVWDTTPTGIQKAGAAYSHPLSS